MQPWASRVTSLWPPVHSSRLCRLKEIILLQQARNDVSETQLPQILFSLFPQVIAVVKSQLSLTVLIQQSSAPSGYVYLNQFK